MSRSSGAWRPSSAAYKNLARLEALFERRFVPAMRHFAELPYVAAVREALPWSFIALIAGIIGFFALEFQTNAHKPFGERLAGAYLPAFGVMAAALTIVLGAVYARRIKASPVLVAGTSALCFALLLPHPFGPDLVTYLHALGPTALFLSMLVVGLVAGAIALASRVVSRAVALWVGCFSAVLICSVVAATHVSVTAILSALLAPLARLGDTYIALVVIVLIEMLLWVVGIHGPAMLAAVVTPVYLTLQVQNASAYSHHTPLPHIVVVSLFLFIFPGGSGATLPLALMLAGSRIPRLRSLGRATILPAIFNTNEPLIFGAPVVLNPYLAIPFVIVPLVLATTTYIAVALGWVARAAYYYPSSIPTFISTYLATFDLRALALVAVNIAISAIIYLPFVRAYERHVDSTSD
jgi:PTS system cellobiose-specific IIC component